MNKEQTVRIMYTNYRGETGERKIIPQRIYFGKTDYHPEEQWLLVAFDIDKNAERTFAIKDIQKWAVQKD